MKFELGQTLGGYEFLDILESSKSGITYKVRNVLAQRFETLKVLPQHVQDDQERVERFVREMKVHARLTHPNIVTFYNASQIEGQFVMTTEFVEGMTLAQILEGNALPLAQIAGYIRQALAALSYAHEQGVVHREITPSNITVTPDGTVKLTGFGLAKARNDPKLTQAGAVMGSLEYISPEQVKGVGELDARADLYSLGVVFYQAATGKVPFQAQSQFEVMLAHVNKAPAPPIELNPALPEEVNRIILKAIAKDPGERFQTAKEFWDALETVAPASEPRAAAPAEPATDSHPKDAVLPPLEAPAAVLVRTVPAWRSSDLMAAGVFLFIIVAVAFFTLLMMIRR